MLAIGPDLQSVKVGDGIMDRDFVAYLRERGVPVVGGIREGLAALDRLGRHAS